MAGPPADLIRGLAMTRWAMVIIDGRWHNGRSQSPGRCLHAVAKGYGYSSFPKISNSAVISLPLVSGPR